MHTGSEKPNNKETARKSANWLVTFKPADVMGPHPPVLWEKKYRQIMMFPML